MRGIKDQYSESNMPLVEAMNDTVPEYISWCTPSIPDDIAQVRGVYKDDISVSFHTLGSFLSNTGIFKHAQELAAEAFDAKYTLFSVNGTTGSNFIALYTLASQQKDRDSSILATRNVHKSVQHACELFHIDIDYLPTNFDEHWKMYLPPSVDQIKKALDEHDGVYDAVLLTNPSYEGLVCDLNRIVEMVHDYDDKTWAYVDEAWGSHIHFTPELPASSMVSDADLAVQSTHKQGAALQQCGMIHVLGDDRVDMRTLRRCHQHLTTTSPSYHLLASLDSARWYLQHRGRERLEEMLQLTREFRRRINSMKGLSTFDRTYCEDNEMAFDLDRTKIQMRTVESGFTGTEIDEFLEEEMSIITEKSDAYTLMFITTFEIKRRDMLSTTAAMADLLENRKPKYKVPSDDEHVPFPKVIEKAWSFPKAVDAVHRGRVKEVPFEQLEGHISAEMISLYPPGIPVIVAGERFNKEVLTYLSSSQEGLMEVIAHDPSLKTALVLVE